jgi:hypothetical protein
LPDDGWRKNQSSEFNILSLEERMKNLEFKVDIGLGHLSQKIESMLITKEGKK